MRFVCPCCLSGCGVSPSLPSRCYCSRVGSSCLPVVLVALVLAIVVARCLRLVVFSLSPAVLSCVVPVACFAPSSSWGRHGLIVVGCRRRPCWSCGSFRRLVSSFALSPRLACRMGVAICVPSSRAARCSACVPWFRSFPAAGRLAPCPSFRRPCLLFPVSVSCGGGGTAVEAVRLVSGCAACLPCLNPCGTGRERLVPACCLSSIRISPRPSCRGGGAIFLLLLAFPLFR